MLFSHYPANACLRYDQLFQQAASQDVLLCWDTLKEDIYVWSFTHRSSPPVLHRPPIRQPITTGQPFHERPTAISRLPPTQGTALVPTQATLTASSREICRRYITTGSAPEVMSACSLTRAGSQAAMGRTLAKGTPNGQPELPRAPTPLRRSQFEAELQHHSNKAWVSRLLLL